jgi:hypothetical protein
MFEGVAAWPKAYIEMIKARDFGSRASLKSAVENYCAVTSTLSGIFFGVVFMVCLVNIVEYLSGWNLLGFGPTSPVTWLLFVTSIVAAVGIGYFFYRWRVRRVYISQMRKRSRCSSSNAQNRPL